MKQSEKVYHAMELLKEIDLLDLEYNQMLQLLEIDEVLYEIVLSLEEDNKWRSGLFLHLQFASLFLF